MPQSSLPSLLPQKDGFWTVNDLADLPEDERRYEIVDGQLIMVPPPGARHQNVVDRLRDRIKHVIPAPLRCWENFGIDLGRSYRIPDLVVFDPTDLGPDAHSVIPLSVLLAIEVVSPSSVTNDRITKPAQYAAAGIPAYWRIETEGDVSLTAYVLHGDVYTEIGTWAKGEVAEIDEPFAISIEVDALVL